MNKPHETLLAKLLLMDTVHAYEFIDQIQADWFIVQWQKNVFNCIKELLQEQKAPDIVQIISIMKEKGQIQKGLIPQIADITTTEDGFYAIKVESLITQVAVEYEQRQTLITVSQIKNSIAEGTATKDQTIKRLSGLLETLKDSIKIDEQPTAYYIGEVLDSHDKAKNGIPDGLELPFSVLKERIVLEDVDMMVVGARPAMGKTAFAVSTAVKLAFEEAKNVDFFALEMSKKQIVRRITGNLTKVDTRKIRFGKCSDKEISKIRALQAQPELDRIRIYEGSHTIEDIARIVTKNKYAEGTDLIIVDYLQKITPSRGSTEFERATANSNDLKKLAQDIQIPILALAQIKREEAKSGRPRLSSLRGTGDIEQDASIVAFLHRPEYYGEMQMEDGTSSEGAAEFLIAKNRELGLDIVRFDVDLTTSSFTSSSLPF